MSAGTYNFTIEQGTAFGRTFAWKDDEDVPIPLVGYSAAMQLRETYDGSIVIE